MVMSSHPSPDSECLDPYQYPLLAGTSCWGNTDTTSCQLQFLIFGLSLPYLLDNSTGFQHSKWMCGPDQWQTRTFFRFGLGDSRGCLGDSRGCLGINLTLLILVGSYMRRRRLCVTSAASATSATSASVVTGCARQMEVNNLLGWVTRLKKMNQAGSSSQIEREQKTSETNI